MEAITNDAEDIVHRKPTCKEVAGEQRRLTASVSDMLCRTL